jgi:hypothetical protein
MRHHIVMLLLPQRELERPLLHLLLVTILLAV